MSTLIESAIPKFQFRNHNARWIDAGPEAVWKALTTLTMSEVTITRAFVAIRYLGGGRIPDGTLFDNGPITMFRLDEPRYVIGGSVARPWKRASERREITRLDEFAAFDEPGWAKYLTDFSLSAERGGTRLRTETRGYCTDEWAWRRFRPYWAAIRLGSSIIRWDMLRAVARRAVRGSADD